VLIKILLLLLLREPSPWLVIQLILTLYEAQPTRVVQMFCLLDPTCGGSRGWFQRNGGARSVTTVLSVIHAKQEEVFVYFDALL
jgi:hypothetical protein